MRALSNLLNEFSLGDWIATISAILSGLAILISVWGWSLRAWGTERRLIEQFGADSYLPEEIKDATRYYVRPDATSIDLSQTIEEGHNIIATREALFKAIDRFLGEKSEKRHVLLLA
ncbi:MAG TPA: hypothetical protein VIR01_18625, partial [Pyrinomonadaceae bacterium]